MKVERREDETGGKFFIEENDRQFALMTYKKSAENVITIDHTEVDSNRRGEGLGERLIKAGVEFARENNLKITPTCPFAKKVIDRTPEFRDVLAD